MPQLLQLLPQPEKHPHAVGQHLIDHKEENRGDEYHHEHHRRRDGGLLAARPGDPAQLLANLLNEFGGVGLGHVRSNHPHRPRPITPSYTIYRDIGAMAHRGDGVAPGARTWQEWRGSNPQPPVLETGALPVELHSFINDLEPIRSPLPTKLPTSSLPNALTIPSAPGH